MSLLTTIYFILVNNSTIPIKLYFSLTSSGDEFLKVSYMDLAKATGNFSESNIIGRGSYGTVYKGQLTKIDLDVAVKIFDLEMQGASKSFLSECAALKSTRHRNLLPIITTCSTLDSRSNPFKALIYEFMPRGNLDTWLHHRGDENEAVIARVFGLAERLSILVNVADALDYLHNGTERSIIHCDLKPTNILLDNDMTARLGDFGISIVFNNSRSTTVEESCSYSSNIPKGTIGYIAPGIFICSILDLQK
jgi:serine/threonine protein kinase